MEQFTEDEFEVLRTLLDFHMDNDEMEEDGSWPYPYDELAMLELCVKARVEGTESPGHWAHARIAQLRAKR